MVLSKIQLICNLNISREEISTNVKYVSTNICMNTRIGMDKKFNKKEILQCSGIKKCLIYKKKKLINK